MPIWPCRRRALAPKCTANGSPISTTERLLPLVEPVFSTRNQQSLGPHLRMSVEGRWNLRLHIAGNIQILSARTLHPKCLCQSACLGTIGAVWQNLCNPCCSSESRSPKAVWPSSYPKPGFVASRCSRRIPRSLWRSVPMKQDERFVHFLWFFGKGRRAEGTYRPCVKTNQYGLASHWHFRHQNGVLWFLKFSNPFAIDMKCVQLTIWKDCLDEGKIGGG
jgi:hypothetical protein